MPLVICQPYVTRFSNTNPNVSVLLSGEAVQDNTGKNTFTGTLPAVSTATKKFGTRSLSFNGTQFIIVSGTEVTKFDTSNFTIEGWAYQTSGNDWKTLISNRNNIADVAGTLSLSVSASQQFVIWGNGLIFQSAANAVPLNQWFHYAAVRNGQTLTSYINGVSIGSTTSTHDLNMVTKPYIGSTTNGAQLWAGYMDGLRVTKGVALYTGPFTPVELV